MVRAAGILFLTPAKTALFLKRGLGGDYPGAWCFPGGHAETFDANIEATAAREAVEEVGSLPTGKRLLLTRSITNGIPGTLPLPAPVIVEGAAPQEVAALPPEGAAPEAVDFTTFLQEIAEPFEVVPDGEHVGYAWAPCSAPPEPLHPGCRIALDRLLMDELGVARAMAVGSLTSPQRYKNVTLWAIRITGTGVAVRRAVKDAKTGKVIRGEEFPWRDPANYLNDDFLARCNGLPVTWYHPAKSLLNSKEFEDRIIGTIMLPFIKGEEVWGVAKVYDDEANAALADGQLDENGKRHPLSTSPGVVLSDPNSPSYKMTTEDGSVLLMEGNPSLVDHVAVCAQGVWDKGGDPAGVANDDLVLADSVAVKSARANKVAKLAFGVTLLDARLRKIARG